MILTSDAGTFNNQWQPGQAYGASPLQLSVLGGNRIEVISFNLKEKTARIRLRHVARRIIVDGPGIPLGGITRGGGGILILPNGKIVRVPPSSPILILAESSTLISAGFQDIQTAAGGLEINPNQFQRGIGI